MAQNEEQKQQETETDMVPTAEAHAAPEEAEKRHATGSEIAQIIGFR